MSRNLVHVSEAIEEDVEREVYDGATYLIARHGEILAHEAVGYADRVKGRAARTDDIFNLFSVTKTFTSVAVLRQIDQGTLSLDTPVAHIIPEFAQRGKQRVNVWHLLTHTAGISANPSRVPPERMGDLEAMVKGVCAMPIECRPGTQVAYSPISGHAVLGEIVRRLDDGGRTFRAILQEDYFAPLGMVDTSIGAPPEIADRRVPVVVRDETPGLFDPELLEGFATGMTEDTEVPAGGALSTALDLYRWTEMLRKGGEHNGVRIVSEGLLDKATSNQTGDMRNLLFDYAREMYGWPDAPAFLGLSFFLRGEGEFPTPMGLHASSRAFAGLGAGSTMYWVDPESGLTFIFLSAGLLEEGRNIERLQRLSDLVHATAAG